MTLIYAGLIEGRDKSEFNTMAKDAITASRAMGGSFSLNVTGVEQLGDEGEEVDALMLYPTPQLMVARSLVEKWNKSEFPDLLPHASIGPAGSAYTQQVSYNTDDISYYDRRKETLPASLYFDRLAVCWGNDRLIFALNNFDY